MTLALLSIVPHGAMRVGVIRSPVSNEACEIRSLLSKVGGEIGSFSNISRRLEA